MADLVGYVVPDPDYPLPVVEIETNPFRKPCNDDAQLERSWRYVSGLYWDVVQGEGPSSWGM